MILYSKLSNAVFNIVFDNLDAHISRLISTISGYLNAREIQNPIFWSTVYTLFYS